jgi:hypothetical protein
MGLGGNCLDFATHQIDVINTPADHFFSAW